MNILIAVTTVSMANGGVSTYVVDLSKAFSALGHKIYVCCDGGEYVSRLTGLNNVEYIRFPFENMQKHPLLLLKVCREFRSFVKKKKIDIIHLNGQCIIPAAQYAVLFTKVPYLWTNHIDAIPQPKLLRLMQKVFRFPIISVSNDLREHLKKELGIKEKYISVVRNGINIDEYYPLDSQEKEALRNQYNIHPDEFVITLLSRMTYGKGHMLLLECVKKLREKRTDGLKIKVLIAGNCYEHERPYFDKLCRYCEQESINMEYLGFQHPRNVFAVSDLYVLPSFWEGFPMSCLEALAMECPMIRSDTPGYSDTIDFGLWFKKGDTEGLYKQLEYALDHMDEMKAKAKTGRRMVEACFTKEVMAAETFSVYSKLLEAKGAAKKQAD